LQVVEYTPKNGRAQVEPVFKNHTFLKMSWTTCIFPVNLKSEGLHKRTEHLNIFLFFLPITLYCSISDILFIGGRECRVLVF